jgi:hypothetical protein
VTVALVLPGATDAFEICSCGELDVKFAVTDRD